MDQRLADIPYFLIEKTIRKVKQHTLQVFADHGFEITIDQWVVLKRVYEETRLSQIEIAESTFKDAPTITRIVDLLTKKGLLKREMNESDRRKFDIVLTEQGNTMVKTILPVMISIRAQGLKGIPQEELDLMGSTMSKIYRNLL